MKEVQPRSALLESKDNLPIGALLSPAGVSPALLAQPIWRLLSEDVSTVVTPQHINFVNIWQKIREIAATSSDFNVALATITTAVGETFQIEGCAIVLPILHADKTNTLQTFYWLASYPELTAHPVSFGATQPELTTQTSVTVPSIPSLHKDAETEPDIRTLVEIWQRELAGLPALRAESALGVPIQFDQNLNGMVSLMRSHSHTWTDIEIEGLQMVSHQIAIAISQRQIQQQLSKQVQYQAVVNQLTMAIRNSPDLNDVLKLATNDTARVLQVRRGMLLRLKYWDPLLKNRSHNQTPKVRVNVTYEWHNQVEPEGMVPLPLPSADRLSSSSTTTHPSFWLSDCSLCQQAFIHPNELLTLANKTEFLQQDPTAEIAHLFNFQEFPALLLAPLESQGTVLGFLVFQHDQPHVWQPEDIDFVKLVSAQVSTAIIQTETISQVQALVEKRTAELRESLAVQAKLYERTRQQIDQLRHLNQVKDEFLSTVSHELRTPLTSMTMAIRMLRQTGLSSDRATNYLNILERQCAQEINLVNDLLALQELEAKKVHIQLQDFELKDLIKHLAELFRENWAAKGLSLMLDLPQQSLRLQSDRDSLTRILLELLTNAGKYSDPNSCVRLRASLQKGSMGNELSLVLCNTGAGISSEELPHIFDKFRRCQGSTHNAIQGTGLGLALVQSLVQHLNGVISAESYSIADSKSWNTCFTLTLPQVFDISEA